MRGGVASMRRNDAAPDSAPGWLVAEVAEGIQRLLVLRLDGCPAADAVEAVALVWADALIMQPISWDEELDAPRIRLAFRRLAASVTRWPAPAELVQFLPARPARPMLPPPEPDEGERERVRRIIEGLRRRFGGA